MPKVETLLLANHAESLNNLLYVSGGGWTDHNRPVQEGQPPPLSRIAIAISILTAWGETNRRFPLILRIEDEDSKTKIIEVEGEMETGRPPGVPEGRDIRTPVAMNLDVTFPHPGGYRVVVEAGSDRRTIAFSVRDQVFAGQATGSGDKA